YNNARDDPEQDRVELAATLQWKLCSIHPFKADGNGGTSRELLAWSLLNSGLSPSAMEEFDDDFFTPLSVWVEKVRDGIARYEEWSARLDTLGR
ncbi:Fic family protein, partial [Nocardia cyriacigeorgica]